MSGTPKEAAATLLTVICDRCVIGGHAGERICPICTSRKFYYWDPDSYLCFAPDFQPLYLEDEKGELVQFVRVPLLDGFDAGALSLDDMLAFLGEWVAADRRRKFRLWYEDGWNCRCWPNGLKAGVISTRDVNLSRCVEECFHKVTAASLLR